jgi:hypothetical protein
LAAAYPSWIRYGGTADPRFVDKKRSIFLVLDGQSNGCKKVATGISTMEYVLTLSNIPKKSNLRSKIVKEEDPEYYRALKAGEFCRMAEEWLLNDGIDIGCRRMKAWRGQFHLELILPVSPPSETGQRRAINREDSQFVHSGEK